MAGENDRRARAARARQNAASSARYARPPGYGFSSPSGKTQGIVTNNGYQAAGGTVNTRTTTSTPSGNTGTTSGPSAADLQRQAIAEQKAATARAEQKAAAKEREQKTEAAKKARAESIRQNKTTREQANAQFRLLGRFDNARDIKLGNIDQAMRTADAALMKSYRATSAQLTGARKDNEKAEGSSSFANTANRLREAGDLRTETAAVGAGESDTLRSQLQAVRNWDANQQDVNRSFFDTLRTVNSSITDLNNDTRTSRINLREQAYSDKEQVWSNFYNQMTDTLTQIYNIEGSNQNINARNTAKKGTPEYENPVQAYERKYKGAAKNAAKYAGKSWESPGISKALRNWQGEVRPQGARLSNSYLAGAPRIGPAKRPEGATLRYVDPPAPAPAPAGPPVTSLPSLPSTTAPVTVTRPGAGQSPAPRPTRPTGIATGTLPQLPGGRPEPELTTPRLPGPAPRGKTTILGKWEARR